MSYDVTGNTGHGHVHPRPDGIKARCGGPGLCPQCSTEAGLVYRPKLSLEAVEECTRKPRHGGAAFPATHHVPSANGGPPAVAVQEGMSLRDYLAAKALTGLLRRMKPEAGEGMIWEARCARMVADAAYVLADAMLAAREGKP